MIFHTLPRKATQGSHHKTPAWTTPVTPWGLDRNEVTPTLRAWLLRLKRIGSGRYGEADKRPAIVKDVLDVSLPHKAETAAPGACQFLIDGIDRSPDTASPPCPPAHALDGKGTPAQPMVYPLVVIVTPVYNGAKFLAETMECVQSQVYPNIVHFVLDNASTDSTPDIIAQFTNRRIPVVVRRNSRTLPLIDNWNAAMRLVPREASYFRLLPADDLMVSHAIEKMVALGEKNPEVTIISCQEWMGPFLLGADIPSDRTVFNGRSLVRASLLNALGFPHLHCLYKYPPGGIPDTFYTPDFYGVRLLATDVDAAMRTLVGGTCAYVHEPLVMTRWHAGSVTSTDMIPNFIKLWSDLQLIDRWGPKVFDSRAEYLRSRKAHLRFYYRHLVLWWAQGKRHLLDQHREWLNRAAAMPSNLDYAYAIAEWPALRAARLLRRLAARFRLVKPLYQITSPGSERTTTLAADDHLSRLHLGN